jgi:hypothetical protein
MHKDYSYNRFGSKGQRVGQAVQDILSKEQPKYLVEDFLDEFGPDYLELIRERASEGKRVLQSPFYILSLLNKGLGEVMVSNVLKHSARCFQTKFTSKEVMNAHPNSVKTMYEVDVKKGEITLLWSIPAWEDCKSIMKHPALYDESLVKNITECLQQVIDQSI